MLVVAVELNAAECSTFTQTLNGSDGSVAGCGARFSCIVA
jgi:hypothetical protein